MQTALAVHSITIVTPYVPNQASLMQGMSPSVSVADAFGLVGGLVAAGIEMDRQNAMNSMVESQGFSAQNELNTDIVNAVRAKGYVVTLMATPRPDAKFLDYYPRVKTDAYLDVIVPGYGYRQLFAASYKPILEAQYRLVTVKGAKIPVQGSVAYTDPPQGSMQFKNLDDLNSRPADVVAGLRSELSEVAAATANALP